MLFYFSGVVLNVREDTCTFSFPLHSLLEVYLEAQGLITVVNERDSVFILFPLHFLLEVYLETHGLSTVEIV